MKNLRSNIFNLLAKQEGDVRFESPDKVLAKVEGAPFVGAVVRTEPKVKKGAPPIVSLSHVILQVNFDYANSVGNQLEREGKDRATYVAGTTHYDTIPDSGLAKSKNGDSVYVRGKLHRKVDTKFFDAASGQEIPASEAESYMTSRSNSSGRQGTDKAVMPRIYKIENVVALQKDGETIVNPNASAFTA